MTAAGAPAIAITLVSETELTFTVPAPAGPGTLTCRRSTRRSFLFPVPATILTAAFMLLDATANADGHD